MAFKGHLLPRSLPEAVHGDAHRHQNGATTRVGRLRERSFVGATGILRPEKGDISNIDNCQRLAWRLELSGPGYFGPGPIEILKRRPSGAERERGRNEHRQLSAIGLAPGAVRARLSWPRADRGPQRVPVRRVRSRANRSTADSNSSSSMSQNDRPVESSPSIPTVARIWPSRISGQRRRISSNRCRTSDCRSRSIITCLRPWGSEREVGEAIRSPRPGSLCRGQAWRSGSACGPVDDLEHAIRSLVDPYRGHAVGGVAEACDLALKFVRIGPRQTRRGQPQFGRIDIAQVSRHEVMIHNGRMAR